MIDRWKCQNWVLFCAFLIFAHMAEQKLNISAWYWCHFVGPIKLCWNIKTLVTLNDLGIWNIWKFVFFLILGWTVLKLLRRLSWLLEFRLPLVKITLCYMLCGCPKIRVLSLNFTPSLEHSHSFIFNVICRHGQQQCDFSQAVDDVQCTTSFTSLSHHFRWMPMMCVLLH